MLDAAGLAGPERAALRARMLDAAREGALRALLEPRGARPAFLAARLWSAHQTHSSDAPSPPGVDFAALPPVRQQPWLSLGRAMLPMLLAEVLT